MVLKSNDSCLAKAADDEPIFVLMARDFSAPNKVRQWANENRRTLRVDKFEEAHKCADAMEHWQTKNPDKARWPD